jgi:hypothetical protein
MPTTHTIIIHGWSDCSDSFVSIKKLLDSSGVPNVGTIYYADYESREDNLTFDDVADGLNDQFIEQGFIDADGNPLVNLNVIVHSTGGLVIRHWISRYYLQSAERRDLCPVKRIIMLAPANFGSPLAHRGKSFLGSLFKGRWKVGDLLEVGRQLLDGLELGSPYQWHLAHRDLLSGLVPYSSERIQVTILVGINDYDGMRGWVNKPGTDGTVVISGTSLDTLKLILDCTKGKKEGDAYTPYQWSTERPIETFAWAVLPGLDHGGIVEDAGTSGSLTSGLLLDALRSTTPATFNRLCDRAATITSQTYQQNPDKPRFQQFAVRAIDDQGNPIPDFTLEFFVLKASKAKDGVTRDSSFSRAEQKFSDLAQKLLLAEFHTHSAAPSHRRFLVNVGELKRVLEQASAELSEPVTLSMRVYVPKIDAKIYYAVDQLQNIVLHNTGTNTNGPALLYENTTTLLEIRVNRLNEHVTVGRTPRKH